MQGSLARHASRGRHEDAVAPLAAEAAAEALLKVVRLPRRDAALPLPPLLVELKPPSLLLPPLNPRYSHDAEPLPLAGSRRLP